MSLSFEESTLNIVSGQLARQQEYVKNLRNQAYFAAGISVIGVSSVGSEAGGVIIGAFSPGEFDCLLTLASFVAILLFLGSLCSACVVIATRGSFTFDIDGEKVRDIKNQYENTQCAVWELISYIDYYFDENEKKLKQVYKWYRFAFVTAIGQFPFWLFLLIPEE